MVRLEIKGSVDTTITFVDLYVFNTIQLYEIYYNSVNGYVYIKWKGKRNSLHRFIMNAQKGQIVDHIDGNKLNNTRENLRFCTKRENSLNCSPKRNKYKGVTKNTACDTYSAKYCKKYLGSFKTQEDAARAYNDAALASDPEFCKLNNVNT